MHWKLVIAFVNVLSPLMGLAQCGNGIRIEGVLNSAFALLFEEVCRTKISR